MLIAGEMERLRPLVGLKGWDYCVVWKLSEDQRFLDWLDCCCAGGGEELLFPVSSVLPCRDGLVQHPRTKSCDLLAQLPSSISLDSGNIHGQTLISNQPRWLNSFCNSSDSSILQETVGTGLLIPVLGGLIELFVAKQVAEDQHIIDFVTTQCHMISMEQEAMANTGNIDLMFSVNVNGGNADLDQKDPNINFLAPISLATAMENLKNDLPIDRIRLGSSSPMNMNLLQHDVFLEGSHDSFLSEKEQLGDDDHKDSSTKRKANQPDSVSNCSEQIDDDDDDLTLAAIDAERRRRKKLNDRLYTLRSLVPKVSKLDRASILGDAIEFVKELQKQAKDLQDELEENSEDESGKIINPNITSNSNNLRSENLNDNGSGLNIGPKTENEESRNQFCKQNPETDQIDDEKAQQQMEPQVEVAQIGGNEFFVKVFYEHKAGGFVKLMEALSSLGMEVTNANVKSCKGLVSNAFKVELKRDSEMVQADHVRDSLLALTKNPSEKWPDYSENGGGGFDFNHHHRHLHSHLFSSHHHLQN